MATNIRVNSYRMDNDGRFHDVECLDRDYSGNLQKLINEVDLPNSENNKTVTITENGSVEITPSSGYDNMKKVTATVNVPTVDKLYAYSFLTGAGEDETSYVYYKQELEETGVYAAFAVDFEDPTLQSSGYIKKYNSVGFANVAVDESTITAGTNLEYTLTRELEMDITL